MADGCGPKTAKILLIIFNLIFWLSGLALLGVGIWMLVDDSFVKVLQLTTFDSEGEFLKYVSYLLIGLGALITVIGFCGCCGAIKENKVLLGIYIGFLFLIMAGEITAGVLAILYKNKVESELLTTLTRDLDVQYDGKNAFSKSLDFAQIYFKCCGINSPNDWKNSTYASESAKNKTGRVVPYTCCKLTEEGEKKAPTKVKPEDFQTCLKPGENETNEEGCHGAVKLWIEKHATILIGIGIGIACLELFGFIFAICLCRNTGDGEYA